MTPISLYISFNLYFKLGRALLIGSVENCPTSSSATFNLEIVLIFGDAFQKLNASLPRHDIPRNWNQES